jgi:flagellar secretion chaperone FliS
MVGYQNSANRYREVAISTANPLQLVIMLYDAAICSIQEAQGHINKKDIAARSRSVNKCIAIISELQSCLNLRAGGEIANSLDRLYDYMKRRIFTANVQQSCQPLVEVEALLENLSSAWKQIAGQATRADASTNAQKMPEHMFPGSSAPATGMQLKAFNVSI